MINEKDRTITVKAEDLRQLYSIHLKLLHITDSALNRYNKSEVIEPFWGEFEVKLIETIGLANVSKEALEDLPQTGDIVSFYLGKLETHRTNPNYGLIEFVQKWDKIHLIEELERLEREKKSLRIKHGIQIRKQKGLAVGRKLGSKQSVIDFIKKHGDIEVLLRKGYSSREIQSICNCSPNTISKMKKYLEL
jgi:hypothetical protein